MGTAKGRRRRDLTGKILRGRYRIEEFVSRGVSLSELRRGKSDDAGNDIVTQEEVRDDCESW